MTPNNEAEENKPIINRKTIFMLQLVALLINSAINNGCTNTPTPRSEAARLRSNVFRGFDNDDEVFLTAWIVTLFNMMAEYDKKA